METIRIIYVMRCFYKDNLFKKIRWEELKTVDEILKDFGKQGIKIPIDNCELQCFKNKLRAVIYAWSDWEWENNGRIVVKIKMIDNPVVYGFTKDMNLIKRNRIRNYRRRLLVDKRDEELDNKTKSIIPPKDVNLLEKEKKQLEETL